MIQDTQNLAGKMSDPTVAIDEIPDTEPNPKSTSLYEELFNDDSETDRPCYLPDKPQHDTLTSDHDDSSERADLTSDSGADSNGASAITEEQTDILEAEPVGEFNSNCADVQEQKEVSDDTGEEKRPGSSCEANCAEFQDDDPEVKPLPKGSAADGSSVESAPHDGRGLSEHEFQENGFIEGSQAKTSKTHVSLDETLGGRSSQAVGSGSSNPTGLCSENGDKELGNFVHERGIENDMDTPTVDLIPGKQHPNEDDTSASWRKHKKHFFILSHAGKPIYSRYGDEHKLAGFSATLQAIMSFVENTGDCIRFIRAGDHQFVFLVKGPIYLVSISSTDEPVQALRGQLELLYGQLLLILTKSLDKCFVKNAKFDLRPLLGGTEVVFSSLIHSFSWNPSSFLHSYTCLPLSHTARQAAGAALQDVADSDLLFALLLSGSKVISLIGAQKASLHPDDILLLSNFVSSSESFRTTESFSPVCLPHYNAMAFLYAYIRYLDTDTCLILITTNPGAFFHLKECRARVESFLMEAHVLRDIASSVLKGGLRVEDLPGDTVYGPLARSGRLGNNTDNRTSEATASHRQRVGVGGAAGLWHFIYRSVYLDQYVHSEFSPPLHRRQTQKRLFHAYQMLYSSMHGGTAGSHQMQYRRDENHVLLCWSTADFEFLAAFDPLAEKSSAITVCNRVCQWIRDVESEIFYLGASPFNW